MNWDGATAKSPGRSTNIRVTPPQYLIFVQALVVIVVVVARIYDENENNGESIKIGIENSRGLVWVETTGAHSEPLKKRPFLGSLVSLPLVLLCIRLPAVISHHTIVDV